MKVTVIGAGSTYTPELVEGLVARHSTLPVTELLLHDIDAERLAVLTDLTRRMVAWSGLDIDVRNSTDLNTAVEAAKFVILQLRVGQQPARILDESIPDRFDLIGQETTGAGGFSKALRTVPIVRSIAEVVRRRADSDAWILAFTNPVGIVTRALLDDGHRAIGLCNVAPGLQRLFGELLGVEPTTIELDHAGLNHLTWVRSVRVAGREHIHELLAPPLRETLADRLGLSPQLLEVLGAIPSDYLKYYYHPDRCIAQQRVSPRATEVLDIERRLLRMYADPALAHKPELLARRGGAHYSEAAVALMASLYRDDNTLHYVNIRNSDGIIPELPDDAVVEVPARMTGGRLQPVRIRQLPVDIHALVETVSTYEALTLQAARSGDRTTALRALLAHPLVRDPDRAVPLLAALGEAYPGLLPSH
ncbi:family 4 glycosyl hydrolase [Streptomyces diastaticus]|uniref:family 4 glycosyl hydrolase n=1 Tax=Streptomyces diastaticus TaxID=1956 RepID=UPI00364DF230